MAYLDAFDAECECGNGISFRDLGDGATRCEWCEYEPFDGVMWREAIGGGYLEQVETHGLDKYYGVEIDGATYGVFANSREIAEYIVGRYLNREVV